MQLEKESIPYFRSEIPSFTNISLQFTGIGHLIIHGNGLITYLCNNYYLDIKNLPLHTIQHGFNFLITNLKSSGFEVVTIFFDYRDLDIYKKLVIEFIKSIYECKDIGDMNDYIKNERVALALGDTSERSQDFLYACASKNLYVGFLDNLEIRIPFVYTFVFNPLDVKNQEEDVFNTFVLSDVKQSLSEDELEKKVNDEIFKFNSKWDIKKIEDFYNTNLDDCILSKSQETISESLCEYLIELFRVKKNLKFDGRILFSKILSLEYDDGLSMPKIFTDVKLLNEYKPEKSEMNYLVNLKQTNEKSAFIHLKNLQKSAQSLFNGKLLFAPIIKSKESKTKKVSKKQQEIINANQRRLEEKQAEQDNLWLKNFFIKYKNSDTTTKKILLEGVVTDNQVIYKRILLLKVEYYSDIWNLEKRSEECDERKIIPCYLNCLEYVDKFLNNDNCSEFVLQKLIDCGFEATVHEILEKNKLEMKLEFFTDDTSAPSDYDLCFQLKYTGDKLKRNLGSKKDPRVLFEPDAWQRKLLDLVDDNKSAIVAAPTSSGKTFICFYAIEKILRDSDKDMVIFCLPTKALANQVSADIYARFAPKHNVKTNIQGSLMKDFCNDPFNCQVLITIPSLLESILNSPPENILPRIKYIIIDEVHKISSEEMGSPIERIFHLSPCPMLVLSATLGNLNGFYEWMAKIERSKNRDCELVMHTERYCELKPYVYSDIIVPINNLFAYSYEHIKKFGFGNDINFLPEELLYLFDSLCAVLTEEQKELLYPLVPERFFKSNILTKKDCKDYERHLLKYFENLIKNNNLTEKQVKKIYKLQTKDSKKAFDKLNKYDEEYIMENMINLLDDLKTKNMLPCIVFNTDRDFINKMAVGVYEKLESMDIEIKRNKAIDKIKKEAKRNRDVEKGKDSWIEESLEAERNYEYKTDKKNIKFTYLDPVTKITDYELEEETRFIKNTKPEYIDMLYRGIGIHHEQMNRKYRNVAEILFRQKHLRVLFATDTLALGINMPCRTVVFAGDSLLLDPLNYKQMAGRAGRRGYDTLGNIVFMGIPQRRVQNLMVSLLPNIKGVYTYTNSSFVGFNLKDSLVKYPLLENTYRNIKKEISDKTSYDLSNIFISEERRRILVDIQLDILHKYFNEKSYLNDLIISNRDSDPSIFVFAILLENNLIDFEPKSFMNTLSHLFEIRPLIFENEFVLPPLDEKVYNVCKDINNLGMQASLKIYDSVLRGLQYYSKKKIHTVLSFIQVSYLDSPKNSYLLDFFLGGSVQKIVKNNKIRSADLFKSLSVINNVLSSLLKWYGKYEIGGDTLKKLSVFYASFEPKFRAIFA
jgi:ATP-dependent RNA helicase DDX60